MKNEITFFCTNYGLNKIQNFFLFLTLFSVIIDPSNSFLGLKTISFMLLFIVSIPYIKIDNILYVLFFFAIYFISLCINFSFESINISYSIATLKSFMFLFLIFVINNNKNFFKYFFYISLILSIATCVVWLIIIIEPALFVPFSYFFRTDENFFFSFSKRTFLGINFISVYHSTSMLCTVFLSYSVYKFLFDRRKKFSVCVCIFSFALFCSGTRANMLCGIGIPFIILAFYLLWKKKFFLFSVFFTFVSFGFLFVVYKLLSDVGETSLDVKSQIFNSYINLFNLDPLDYLFFGDGPGAVFYANGHNKIVTHTELSYLDLIRNYGLPFSIVIVCLYLYPLLLIYKKYEKNIFLSFLVGYVAFLFISGTNPYLLNSNGFSVLVLMWYIGISKEQL